MSIRVALSAKREQVLAVAAKHGARDVRVFGSVARGEESPESDVDLLVRFDPGVTLLGHSRLVRELEEVLGTRVDVVSARALRDRYRQRVLEEAEAL